MMIVEPCNLNINFPYPEERYYYEQPNPLLANNYNYFFNINQSFINQNNLLAHGPLCHTIVKNKIVLCETCAREFREKIKNKLRKKFLEMKKENEEKKEKELNYK